MKKTIIAALIGATSVSGCMTVGNDGHSYVGVHVPGTEKNSAIKKACSFDNTAGAAFAGAALTLLLGGDGRDAAAVGLATGALAHNISTAACRDAQEAAKRAMAQPNKEIKWYRDGARGSSVFIPSSTGQTGRRKDVIWVDGKEQTTWVSLKKNSNGRWQSV